MSQFLVIELSTGVVFQASATYEEDALALVSKRRMGSDRHTELFRAQKLMSLPAGAVARLTIFDMTLSKEEPKEGDA